MRDGGSGRSVNEGCTLDVVGNEGSKEGIVEKGGNSDLLVKGSSMSCHGAHWHAKKMCNNTTTNQHTKKN